MGAQLTLYQKDDCHLCDLALEVLAVARAPEFDSVFIEDDPVLAERYGIRVPVLREERSGTELDWPFDVGAVHRLLAATASPGQQQ
ncbi:MAG TPA: glutaredoxin family protein [Xanthomonadaceae bacterium]|nr:glutaredoxin family protein [Xanthomonadaceae bacterium]